MDGDLLHTYLVQCFKSQETLQLSLWEVNLNLADIIHWWELMENSISWICNSSFLKTCVRWWGGTTHDHFWLLWGLPLYLLAQKARVINEFVYVLLSVSSCSLLWIFLCICCNNLANQWIRWPHHVVTLVRSQWDKILCKETRMIETLMKHSSTYLSGPFRQITARTLKSQIFYLK